MNFWRLLEEHLFHEVTFNIFFLPKTQSRELKFSESSALHELEPCLEDKPDDFSLTQEYKIENLGIKMIFHISNSNAELQNYQYISYKKPVGLIPMTRSYNNM